MAKSKSKQYKRQGLYLEALEHLENYIDEMSTKNRSDLDHNKDEIQVNFEQIDDLKVRNRSLLNHMNQMFETIESTNDSMISFELEEKINHALLNDFIKPYFQLKWSVEDKKFIGAEALMRWIDGDTFIPPNQFIDEVENSSIIMKMSEKIIRESFKFCKKVHEDIQDEFVVSINISPYQLAHQDLAKLMRNELLLHNLEGRHVEIEITERSFVEQNPKILEELYALSELGIRIALDDFGTGYSSLSCVNDFPIDVIKIDRSLVSNIESGDKSAKLLAGIIRMMKELELETVAEGVENEVQANMLIELGCDCIQGYYYAKPESEYDVLNRLKTYVNA
jgi:EAL domain-containing protein (putative c-di-GMP-specific phosphodiesterase class I)